MGKRGPKPKQIISTEWSSELAYVVGLIATDGCLSRDGRHINFTSNDLQLIQTFMQCLGIKNRIGRKKSGFANTWAYNLQFGSVFFYRWLQSIGLTPAKSKTMRAIRVPRLFFRDFLRGLFDGDGSFYSYRDMRWHSSFMYYLIFGSASKKHVSWLQKTIAKYYGIRGHGGKQKHARVYQLKYAKREAEILIRQMYHSLVVPRLNRKFNKIMGALKENAKYARIS